MEGVWRPWLRLEGVIKLAFERERDEIETLRGLEYYVSSKLCREKEDSSDYDCVRVGSGC